MCVQKQYFQAEHILRLNIFSEEIQNHDFLTCACESNILRLKHIFRLNIFSEKIQNHDFLTCACQSNILRLKHIPRLNIFSREIQNHNYLQSSESNMSKHIFFLKKTEIS